VIQIDGSFGEGGGQIVRSSLALSMVTGQPFRIDNIRANRPKPGLVRQHLTALHAAAKISNAAVDGDHIGSTAFTFTPGQITRGDYTFSIGTAGSTTLVLQTILLPLLTAGEPSTLTLQGGTHNPLAPPFDFLAQAYIPLVNRMGAKVAVSLTRPGFYPAGGGEIRVNIKPAQAFTAFDLLERGKLQRRCARAVIANLPDHIAEREIRVFTKRLNWPVREIELHHADTSAGPGNVVTIELAHENVTEVFTGFGEVRRTAEAVATHAVQQYQRYLKSNAPVGEYLTDQLMLPFAIARGGSFLSTGLSRHAQTHQQLIHKFLATRIETDKRPGGETLLRFL
jgi:RNA 3'-terminal phosphate cyclase (ATP)